MKYGGYLKGLVKIDFKNIFFKKKRFRYDFRWKFFFNDLLKIEC